MENPNQLSLLIASIIQFFPRLGLAILIFFVFWFVGRILRGIVQRFGLNRRLSQDIINLMVQVSEISLQIFGLVTALGTLGINVGAMIAGLGLVGFALGFALKDLLSNFIAGFLILVYNPFVRGDSIKVGAHEGMVIEINMRYTVLQAQERKILIPNATLFAEPVIVQRQVSERVPGGDAGGPTR